MVSPKQKLPIFILGDRHRGPLISLGTRLLIPFAVNFAVATSVILAKSGVMWSVVPKLAFGIVVSSVIVVGVNYLFWLPRYRMH